MRILLFLLCAAVCVAGETRLGKALSLASPVTVAELMAKPEASVGKTVQVKGKVTEVCQMMGCWMALAEPVSIAIAEPGSKALVRVKVNDGEIEFPKSSVGKMAVAEGKLQKFELTREQAVARMKHEAEEQGRKFNEAQVKSGMIVYQIQGTGAVIHE
jgi:hypothetical protein